MGVVYKARDTRLDRFVAVKVLPAEATADPARRRRFIQEAKAASALNHPSIVTIYDIGSEDGIDFIAMEFVQGRTLDRVIANQSLPSAKTVRYGMQIADALAKAHAAGIVHRDIKPSNVMITDTGAVKVLDFGIAKLTAADETSAGAVDATKTSAVTGPPRTTEGRVIGTIAYMSPEQAAGQRVDSRSDIFSLGAVLYEMATGVRAFAGNDSLSTLTALLANEPRPPSEISPAMPVELERIILRCLRKDPARRFQGMADLVVELEEIGHTTTSTKAQPPVRIPTRRLAIAAGIGAVLLAIGGGLWVMTRPSLPPPVISNLTSTPGDERYASPSPDGTQVAFAWNGSAEDNTDIYIKTAGAEAALRLTTDPAEDSVPAWSPDGSRIAFIRRQAGQAAVYLTPPAPGAERKLVDVRSPTTHIGRMSVSWTPDARWLAMDVDGGLSLVPVAGGEPRQLLAPPGDGGAYYFPAIAPSGKRLGYVLCAGLYTCDVYVADLAADFSVRGEPRRLTQHAAELQGLAWTPDEGSFVYGALFGGGPRLWRVSASGGAPERIELAAVAEFPAVSAASHALLFTRGGGDVDIWKFEDGMGPVSVLSSTTTDFDPQLSPDGHKAAFVSSRGGRGLQIWVSALDGSSSVAITEATGRGQGSPRWSPDGRWIAYDAQAGDGNWDIYVIEAAGGQPRRLTTHPAFEHFASWSRDGQTIYFRSARTGRSEIWRIAASGKGEPVQVTTNGGAVAWESWDGQTLFYTRHDGNGPQGITSPVFARPVSGGTERQVIDAIFRWDFYPVQDGIYYVALIESRRYNVLELRFLELATGQTRVLSKFQARTSQGLSATSDGKIVIYSGRAPGAGSDLMTIQNFR